MALEVKVDMCHEGIIFSLFGKLDSSETGNFLNILEAHDDQNQALLIDVANVALIDSTGLGLLALLAKKNQKKNREVKIVNPSGQVRECFTSNEFSLLNPSR